jgi:hypothetical protein
VYAVTRSFCHRLVRCRIQGDLPIRGASKQAAIVTREVQFRLVP